MNDRLYRSRDDRMLAGVAAGLAEQLDLDPTLVRLAWVVLVPLTGGLALLAYIVMAIVVPEEEGGKPAAPWTNWSPGSSAMGATAAPSAPPSPPGASPLPAHGVAPAPPPPPPPAVGMGAAVPPPMTRAEWRAQRRAYRAARRGQRGPGAGGLIFGSVLVLAGVWLLLRQYVPAFDPDRFWPFVLVGLGVLLLVYAVARRPEGRPEPGGTGGQDGPGGPGGPAGPDGKR